MASKRIILTAALLIATLPIGGSTGSVAADLMKRFPDPGWTRAMVAKVEGHTMEAKYGFAPRGPFKCHGWNGRSTPSYSVLCRTILSDNGGRGRGAVLDIVFFKDTGGPEALRAFFHSQAKGESVGYAPSIRLTTSDGVKKDMQTACLEPLKDPENATISCVFSINSSVAVVGMTLPPPGSGRANVTENLERTAKLAMHGALFAVDEANIRPD